LWKRSIQPENSPQCLGGLLVALALAEQRVNRVPRNQAHQQERNDGDTKQDKQDRDNPRSESC
jgi:hypothetical protein